MNRTLDRGMILRAENEDDLRGDIGAGPSLDPYTAPYSDSEFGRVSVMSEILSVLTDLYHEAVGLLNAEKAYYKTRLDFTKGQIIRLVIFAAAIALAGLLLLIGVTVGMLLILTKYLGPIIATIVLIGVLLIVMALLALASKRTIKNLKLKS